MASNKEGLPSLKKDLQNSLLFLKRCGANGDSLFDHLSNVISKVIDERPVNVVDHFEQFSERVRLETFRMNENLVEEGYKEPERLAIAKKLLPMLIEKKLKQRSNEKDNDDDEPLEPSTDDDEDDEGDVIYHEQSPGDLCELQFYWNLLGVGFSREEVFLLSHSIERLKENPALAKCRFWGKMFGLKSDYYVVESTLTESSQENRINSLEKTINIMKASEDSVVPTTSTTNANTKVENNDDKDKSDLRGEVEGYPAGWKFSMKVPVSRYRPPVEVPAEPNGNGVNRHVYYVCNDLNEEWIELPLVTPHQVNVSRRIKKYLTGDLNKPIDSYPSFPGTERNYLRALIARISAGTHISPRGFFKIESNGDEDDSEDDDDDDDATLKNNKKIIVNESYRPWSIGKLLKLDFWQHHKPEILKQGRVSFFEGIILNENDDGGASSDTSDEDDDLEETNNETKPETPIPLFASCSGDWSTNDGISPWTIRLSDAVETLILVQSRIWPGAYAFVKNRTCDNIYIGYGHKYSSTNYTPTAIPQLSHEFPADSSDVIEDEDPPFAEEHSIESQREILVLDDLDSVDGDEVDADQ